MYIFQATARSSLRLIWSAGGMWQQDADLSQGPPGEADLQVVLLPETSRALSRELRWVSWCARDDQWADDLKGPPALRGAVEDVRWRRMPST